jgi:hypothetical protein
MAGIALAAGAIHENCLPPRRDTALEGHRQRQFFLPAQRQLERLECVEFLVSR